MQKFPVLFFINSIYSFQKGCWEFLHMSNNLVKSSIIVKWLLYCQIVIWLYMVKNVI